MEIQPQNPEFRNNPENFHPCASGALQTVWTQITTDRMPSLIWIQKPFDTLIVCVLDFFFKS